jgi:hypothetical protein
LLQVHLDSEVALAHSTGSLRLKPGLTKHDLSPFALNSDSDRHIELNPLATHRDDDDPRRALPGVGPSPGPKLEDRIATASGGATVVCGEGASLEGLRAGEDDSEDAFKLPVTRGPQVQAGVGLQVGGEVGAVLGSEPESSLGRHEDSESELQAKPLARPERRFRCSFCPFLAKSRWEVSANI